MLFVAIVIVPTIDVIARVGIYLPAFGRVELTFYGTLVRFNRSLFFPCFPLFRHWDEQDIDRLPPSRLESMVGQIGVKLLEQGFTHAPLGQVFAKQPDRLGLGKGGPRVFVDIAPERIAQFRLPYLGKNWESSHL